MQEPDEESGAFDDEGARHRRRAYDGYIKMFVPFAGTAAIGLLGWAISLETRIGNISAIQAERTIKVASIETKLADVGRVAYDPAPKPETRIEMLAIHKEHQVIDDRVDRLETRLNYIHNYLMALPVRPPPLMPSRRGDIRLEDYIHGTSPPSSLN